MSRVVSQLSHTNSRPGTPTNASSTTANTVGSTSTTTSAPAPTSSSSPKGRVVKCFTCAKKKQDVGATVRCVHCKGKALCDPCWRTHFDLCDDHACVPVSKNVDVQGPLPPLQCAEHPMQDVICLCATDNVLVCALCITEKHNSHAFVAIEKAFREQNSQAIVSAVDTWISKFREAIPKIAQMEEQVQERQQTLVDDIEAHFDKLLQSFLSIVTKARDQLIADVMSCAATAERGLGEQHTKLTADLKKLEEWSQGVKQHLQKEDHARTMEAIIQLKSSLNDFESRAPDLQPCTDFTLAFHPSKLLTPAALPFGILWDSDAVASMCHTQGTGTNFACWNKPSEFLIIAVDQHGFQCTSGGAQFDIFIDNAPEALITVDDLNNGSYRVQYTILFGLEGPFMLNVKYRDEHLPGSPFGPLLFADPSKCAVGGDLVTHPRVNQECKLVIFTNDVNGNRLLNGGERVAAVVEDGEKKFNLMLGDHNDGAYIATYTPADISVAKLHVTVNGTNIHGSPFTLKISSGIPVAIVNGPSRILVSDVLCSILHDMLPSNRRRLTLLHDSRMGSRHADFWRVAQNRGHILVVIKHTNGCVFGGYVEDVFMHRGGWIVGSERNFVFRLTGQPLKLMLTAGQPCGVYMDSSGGAGFRIGDAVCAFHSNLGVLSSFISFTTAAPGYTLPTPVNDSSISGFGDRQWHVPEAMEVFGCDP